MMNKVFSRVGFLVVSEKIDNTFMPVHCSVTA